MRLSHLLLVIGCLALGATARAQNLPSLRVCLAEDSAPYSSVENGKAHGLDVSLLAAVAGRTGRAFQPVWFESRYDKEGNLSLDARALLAAEACDLVAGIPLYEPHLLPMIAEKARTPDYPGAKPLRQRPWQVLVPVIGGAAYRATALALIARDRQDGSVIAIEALQGRAVAVRAGSMASLALAGWHGGAIASSIRGYNVREDVLGALAEGRADFALVDIAVWDRYRAMHPQTTLLRTGFDHPVKLNIGLLARASDEALLREVEAAMAADMSGGVIDRMAAEEGATWVAPVKPIVRPALTIRDFTSGRN